MENPIYSKKYLMIAAANLLFTFTIVTCTFAQQYSGVKTSPPRVSRDSSECLVRRDRLADGNYTYSNSNYTLTFTIDSGSDSGGECINKKHWVLAQKYFGPSQGSYTYNDIENATLTNKSSGQVEKQTGGEIMKVSGSIWYQFQTPLCNYSFDVPNKRLKLERFDCKKDINYLKYKDENIILKKN